MAQMKNLIAKRQRKQKHQPYSVIPQATNS